jgi:serine/threonine protein kinase
VTQEFEQQTGSTPTPPGGGTGFVFPSRSGLVRTSETIINPERRAATESSVELLPVPSSALCGVLFPNPEAIQQTIPNPAGVELGHFRIQSAIRSGGMGAVFQALDTRLNRIVALKVLPPSQSRDLSAVQRFRNEAQAAAQLDHDNIARVFYIGEDKALHFIAFEFIRGTNLREIVQHKGKLPPAEAVNYTLQVASALAHAAEHGVVHRDIKPSNIIVMPSGRAKLVDLGLARSEHRDKEPDLTVAGTTLGTFDYISPEQAKDPRTVDVRSDIYSLGCTLYHLLTGEPPYPQGTVLQKLLDHQGKEAPDPRLKNRRVSAELASIVRMMMASDVRKRYQTAGELIRDLLFVANSLGLRSINSEGLMWLSVQNSPLTFWERHASWLAMGACLLLFVGYLQFGYLPNQSKSHLGTTPADQATLNPFDSSRDFNEKNRAIASTGTNGELLTNPFGNAPGLLNGVPDLTAINSETGPQSGARGKGRVEDQARANSSKTPEPGDDEDWWDEPNQLPDNLLNTKRPIVGVAKGPAEFQPNANSTAGNDGPRPENEKPTRTPNLDNTGDKNPVAAITETSTTAVASNDSLTNRDPGNQILNPQASSNPIAGTVTKAPIETISQSPIVVIKSDGTPGQPFPTLEAACAIAQDGNVIELRYNGPRVQSPVRIRNKITIRAGKGYRPVIEFVPKDIPASGYETRMITLSGGSLDLVDIGVLISVKETITTDAWVLISTRRTDSVRFQRVAITVHNPSKRQAAVLEVRGGASRMVSDMEMPGSATSQMATSMTVHLTNSVVRGGVDLFHIKTMLSARLDVENCLLALEGTVLRQTGSMDVPEKQPVLSLRLYQVTAVANSGLVVMDVGDPPRQLGPVAIDAQNNIFTTVATANKPAASLITISGNEPADDLRKLIAWNGQKNFYDGFQSFWTTSTAPDGPKSSIWDFDEWKFRLASNEIDPHTSIVLRKQPLSLRPLADLTPVDFALDETASGNPALFGANNGENAGANLSTLEKLNVSVGLEAAERSN